jgi:hypothetical protein
MGFDFNSPSGHGAVEMALEYKRFMGISTAVNDFSGAFQTTTDGRRRCGATGWTAFREIK